MQMQPTIRMRIILIENANAAQSKGNVADANATKGNPKKM